MEWNYGTLPSTGRDVLVAFIADDVTGDKSVRYKISCKSYGKEEWLLPNTYQVVAWCDFDRCTQDGNGRTTMHSWVTTEGL